MDRAYDELKGNVKRKKRRRSKLREKMNH